MADMTDGGLTDGWSAVVGEAPGEIRLRGALDFSVIPFVRARLLQLLGTDGGDRVLDMDTVDYLDSSGLALLIELQRLLAVNGRVLRIGSASPQVRKLLALTELGDRFGLAVSPEPESD